MSKPNPSREAALNDLTSRIFSTMLGEIIMDAAIQAQQEVVRTKIDCDVCKTRCSQAHAPGPSKEAGTSKAPSPMAVDGGTPSQQSASASASNQKADGNTLLECLECQRPIAFNRYAQHLASCMNLGTGVRRAVARTAVAKTKLGEGGRSSSPYVMDSVLDDILDDAKAGKSKSKPKAIPKQLGDESGSGIKRPGSPQVSPAKKQKKGRPQVPRSSSFAEPPRPPTGRPAPPSSHPKSKLPGSTPKHPTPTPSVVPSTKSRSRSRTASFSSSSSDSSHGGDTIAGLPGTSIGGTAGGGASQATTLTADNDDDSSSNESDSGALMSTLPKADMIGKNVSRKNSNKGSVGGSVTGSGPPRRPPSSSVSMSVPPPIPRAMSPKQLALQGAGTMHRLHDDYLMDAEGEETGSSSESDG